MATVLQFRRGSASEAAAFTGAPGELFIDMTNMKMYVHDGSTQGGLALDTDTTLDGVAINAAIDSKQDALVSGTSLKTVQGQSLLGSGNLDLSGIENLTSLSLNAGVLEYVDEEGQTTSINLNTFMDDTNLITSVNGETGDVVTVKTLNGQTGDVTLNGLPGTAAEFTAALYDGVGICADSAFASDGTSLTATYLCSISDLRLAEDELLHVFGHSVHNGGQYQLFSGENPPLTTSWSIPDWELESTFLAYGLTIDSEVDNGDGTYTLSVDDVKASIPTAFTDGVATDWMQMNIEQLKQALSGEDVTEDGTSETAVVVISDAQYVTDLTAELSGIPTYSKNTSILHVFSGIVGDFIQ